MQKKHFPKPVIPMILVLVSAVTLYFVFSNTGKQEPLVLSASGTIEAESVFLSPEISGRISEVFFEEGDAVNAGDPLFRIDDTLLQAQRAVAVANVNASQAALSAALVQSDLTQAALLSESSALRTQDWTTLNPSGYTLPGGYFATSDLRSAAENEVEKALQARDEDQNTLTVLLGDPRSTDFATAETQLLSARAAILVTQDVLKAANLSTHQELRDAAQAAYDQSKTDLEIAQAAYDALKDSDIAKEIISARVALTAAQDHYDIARDYLRSFQFGDQSLRWKASDAAVEQAHRVVEQTNAQLALIDTQIAKLTIFAPISGRVLTSSIEIGEFALMGLNTITLGKLDPLVMTVYIPEIDLGKISLGQTENLSVDSFPGVVFPATVTHISDQAEFTPRNVQTTAGRKTTVFAVKLQVKNPEDKLKPGMPADLIFLSGN
ncbi:MAG: efflux RND transporter periplasmic adaptor subunit [Chloroflexi bacterium]|nr:efflux RND transporter periplasmic adaptor subunit [Chloroflexota bacterium]